MHDAALAAFHRLLTEAAVGGQAKVDAIVALVQRTVLVVPWPGGTVGWRTLTNSAGLAALPVFTSPALLEEGARRFGWVAPDGSMPYRELGARGAMSYAQRHDLAFMVVDIGSPHALEIARAEFEPLLSPAAQREGTGPFAGRGTVSSSLYDAVRPSTTRPPSSDSIPAQSEVTAVRRPSDPPAESPGLRRPEQPDLPAQETHATGRFPRPGGPRPTGSSEMSPRRSTAPPTRAQAADVAFTDPVGFDDAFVDALTERLRGFMEVDWATLLAVAEGNTAQPAVGLVIDPALQTRLPEIEAALKSAARERGLNLQVQVLSTPELRQAARSRGEVFYPFRRR
jgi:hypothetical protein